MTASQLLQELVLPSGVEATAVSELSRTLREELAADAGDVMLSRPGTRSTSRVISGDTWDFVANFRTPATVVEVVVAYSQHRNLDPEAVLDSAAPIVADLVNAHLLTIAGASVADPSEPRHQPGDRVGSVVVSEVIQVHEDVEVYRGDLAGRPVALKFGRSPSGMRRVNAEADLLADLAGLPVPELLERSSGQESAWFAAGWLDGAQLPQWVQAQQRLSDVTAGLADLADALAALHERGVVHRDLHTGNVVMVDDRPMLLDLGAASVGGEWAGPHRALDGRYTEPELARARLAELPDPAPTPQSEQFAFGVLAYTAIARTHPFDLPLDRQRAMERIVAGGMVAMRQQGAPSHPEVEKILARTLATDPDERYPSLREVAAALRDATDTGSPAVGVPESLRAWRQQVLARYDAEPSAALLSPGAPVASVYWGAAGVALALLLAAQATGEEHLLASSTRWSTFAAEQAAGEDSFAGPSLDLPPGLREQPSLLHGLVGTVVVKGLVGAHTGMGGDLHAAAAAIVTALQSPDDRPSDPTLGSASLLWGAAAVSDAAAGDPTVDLGPLRAGVEDRLGEVPPQLDSDGYLGMAHGLAGLCHATLRAVQAFELPTPGWLEDSLNQLFDAATGTSEQAWWPIRPSQPGDVWSGWCHGVAGHVLLFSLAARTLPDQRWSDLALRAGEYVARHPHREVVSLCCGLAGQVFALLDLYQLSGEPIWLERATGFAERAVATATPAETRSSLFKGELGLALAVSALEARTAGFPLLG